MLFIEDPKSNPSLVMTSLRECLKTERHPIFINTSKQASQEHFWTNDLSKKDFEQLLLTITNGDYVKIGIARSRGTTPVFVFINKENKLQLSVYIAGWSANNEQINLNGLAWDFGSLSEVMGLDEIKHVWLPKQFLAKFFKKTIDEPWSQYSAEEIHKLSESFYVLHKENPSKRKSTKELFNE